MNKYGDKIPLSVGYSTILADLDFETYSEAGFLWNEKIQKYVSPDGGLKKGISVTGAAAYAEHPTCEILCCAYDLKEGLGKRLWTPGMPPPLDLFEHIYSGKLLEAWNVTFERLIWQYVCYKKYNWPLVPLIQWRDAVAKALAFGLPRSLENAGNVLNISAKKLGDGKRLINKFSIPQNPTVKNPKRRIFPHDDPEDQKKLHEYNLRDIEAESEIVRSIPDLNDFETKFWIYDQIINLRGIEIDMKILYNAISIIEQLYIKYNQELERLTNGHIKSGSEVQKILGLARLEDSTLTSLDEEHLAEALKNPKLSSTTLRILKIRQLIGSASVKKLYAMKNQVTSDNRLHDLLVYHGARTGREAGSGVQPQNLPNSGPAVVKCECTRIFSANLKSCPDCMSQRLQKIEWDSEAIEQSIELIETKSADCIEYYHPETMDVISGCLRSLFIAKEGHDLICSDYNSIEARVLAILAGEEWRIEVFKTHGRIYELSASKITGVPFEEFLLYKQQTGNYHPLRKTVGKVSELASGYAGWIGAWSQFGAREFFTEDEMKQAILKWRSESPKIVEFWGGQSRNYNRELFGLEGAAVNAILNPGYEYHYREISYKVLDKVLYCKLPSGRFIVYHKPRLVDSVRRAGEYTIKFEGWNSSPKQGRTGWIELETYGGKLCENVVQAVSRDILANAVINLEDAGYSVVLHVHDEIIAEIPKDFGSIEELEELMMKMPPWAMGWPIKAQGGWRNKRYKK